MIFPTDTVYGIGASIKYSDAMKRIYKIKKRPKGKSLIYLIGNKKDVKKFTKEIPIKAKDLMKKFWPGPLTLIFKARNKKRGETRPRSRE